MRHTLVRHGIGFVLLLIIGGLRTVGAQTPTVFVADYFGVSSRFDGRLLALSDTVTVRDHQGVLAGKQYAFPGNGGYAAHVYGDDPTTPVDEGASEGDTLRFYINGHPAQGVSGDPTWHNGVSRALELEAFSVTDDTLAVTDIFGKRGQILRASVVLSNTEQLTRILFSIQPQMNGASSDLLELSSFTSDLQSNGFSVSVQTAPDGWTTVDCTANQGVFLETGIHVIAELTYAVSAELAHRATVDLIIDRGRITDTATLTHAPSLKSGIAQIGIPGDITGGPGGEADGQINVIDVIRIVHFILAVGPAPGAFDRFIADLNDDGNVSILDVIRLIRQILGLFASKSIGPSTSASATIYLESIRPGPHGDLIMPLMVNSDDAVAALQATLQFEPDKVDIGAPVLTDRSGRMIVLHRNDSGLLRVILFNLSGESIAAGSGSVLMFPVQKRQGTDASPVAISIHDAVMVDWEARAILLTISKIVPRIESLPVSYSLGTARPNPFNPSTQIDYEVPQQAHITLIVYNLLGQEVVTLVDETKAAGRYTVAWNGRNRQGIGVASGVYMYRMISSNGYSETRRMTLLK